MLVCERLDTTDSTQREALRRIAARGSQAHVGSREPDAPANGAPIFGLWTTHQTQGLASHGRRWQDSPSGGGLALSIAWQERQSHANTLAWPIRWSLLAVSALEAAYPELCGRLGVKWPNDIMHDDAKLAGVLVSRHFVSGQWWCVAGIGINLAWHITPSMDRPITDLKRLGVAQPDPETIVSTIAGRAFPVLSTEDLNSDAGFWRDEFERRDVAAGMRVRVVHPVTNITIQTGVNRGISPTGELLLDVDGNPHVVAVGELSLRPAHGEIS
jgi:BirA family transcriptional regulator, biotin operon repressor / biotin---[acetyl-CoA-carboxylase] ligase